MVTTERRPVSRSLRRVASLFEGFGGIRPNRHHDDTAHRDIGGNAARAAVLGAGDGLLTNVSLVLGVAGASTNQASVRLAGVAGLLAGAFSMAAGELLSVRAQDELVQRELQVERNELRKFPDAERRELAAMYRARGVPAEDAETVSRILSAKPSVALDTHARLELGIDPDDKGSAVQASVTSFVAFALGAVLPLFPWFFIGGTLAVVLSIVIGAVAALSLGGTIGALTGRGILLSALRQFAAAAVAAGVTYAIGTLFGVSTG
ncbi:MAG: VIT1/CCC1 transporter family protein [Acidimicrobiaceae bacterium]|nr:VIT1/CCC1 transporter family protein [Acidimicrobiaceae bacterium]